MDLIGESFRSEREASGLSIEEVSQDLDLKPVVIENLEAGKIGAFGDVFKLKEVLCVYAKYLGLDENKTLDAFNEYMFEYTSKIPVDEIEKSVLKLKKEEPKEKIVSPYTKEEKEKGSKLFVLIYVIITILVLVSIYWSFKQITSTYGKAVVINYGK